MNHNVINLGWISYTGDISEVDITNTSRDGREIASSMAFQNRWNYHKMAKTITYCSRVRDSLGASNLNHLRNQNNGRFS